MNKQDRENEREYLVSCIEDYAYLNDEEQLQKHIESRKARKKKYIQQIQKWSVEEILNANAGLRTKEEVEKLKNKFDGIAETELDEYVDLLVQRELIEDRKDLKELQVKLSALDNSPRNYNGYLDMEAGSDELKITDIQSMDMALETEKQDRKKRLGTFAKFSAAFGISTATLTTIIASANGVGLLTAAIMGLASPAGAIALIGAVLGAGALKQALHNKKVTERLKETGMYDLFEEAAKADKKIEEFEVSKGMKK